MEATKICKIEKKYLTREGWSRVEKSRFSCMELDLPGLKGEAGLLYLEKVNKPLMTKIFDHNFKIVDNGFLWMQIAPAGENWWLTVMFNDQREIVQYYIDITRRNFIAGRESWFEDLMLDVVIRPDGRITLLDQDELDLALEQGNITEEEHRLSCDTAREIQENLPGRFAQLENFATETFAQLLKKLPEE